MGKQHTDNSITILDALLNVAPPEGWPLMEIVKRCAVPKSSAQKALKVLVDEKSVEKVKSGNSYVYRGIPDEPVEPTDDEASAEASEAAILAAEGMTPEQVADVVEQMEDLPPDADNPQPRESKPKKRTKANANDVMRLKVAFDIAHEQGAPVEEFVGKALAALDDGVKYNAIQRCHKSVAENLEIGALDPHYSELLSFLDDAIDSIPKPTRGGGGGRRVSYEKGKEVPSTANVRNLSNKAPFVPVFVVPCIVDDMVKGEQVKLERRVTDDGRLQIIATLEGATFDPQTGKRVTPLPKNPKAS